MTDNHGASGHHRQTRLAWRQPRIRRIDTRDAENAPNAVMPDGQGSLGS